jgi:hypothetical protein
MLALPTICVSQSPPTEVPAAAGAQNAPVPPDRQQDQDHPKTDKSKDASDADDELHPGLKGMGKDFLLDQKKIWTSPSKLRFSDTEWLVPFAGISAGLFVTDRDVSGSISHTPKDISHYNNLSNAGLGALVGGAAGMWLLSFPSHNSHWRETGLLAGEAAFNALVPVEIFKYGLGRERPLQGNGAGDFFQGGTSFPSEHTAAAWAVAGVIGHEYPGPSPRILAYGLASLVSYSRVKGVQHFPSDVFIGGIVGSMIAQEVYNRHHDPELPGSDWRPIGELFRDSRFAPENLGTPYVPLDSWVYPALDRLAALNLVDSGFSGMRPWTRRECARLTLEAEDHLADADREAGNAEDIVSELKREFDPELDGNDRGTFRV